MTEPAPAQSSSLRWPVVVIFLGAFLLVAFTAGHYGVTWDEPNYFHASDLHNQWFKQFFDGIGRGDPRPALDDAKIKEFWHWDPYHVPHPPFSRIVSGVTKALFAPYIDKFTAYRLGPALFFGLLAALMYAWMSSLFDRITGLFSALACVLVPNLFGFAHFAMTDMPLTAMWFATVYCFWRGVENWKWSIALGIVWGLALATKFPALLLPIPLLLWAHLYHRKSYSNNIFSMVFLSPVVMIATQPYMWHQPFLRVLEFVYEGVSRGYRTETNFTVFFFDRLYFSDALPKYFPFFMTAVTQPETILAMSLIGVAAIARLARQRPTLILFLMNALFILLTGVLPGAVLHDVNRIMLPAVPFFIALAGAGFFAATGYLTERVGRFSAMEGILHLRGKIAGALLFLALLPPALDLLNYHPYELSYYNRTVGGIRGAYRRGLELTYLGEVFTPGFIDFLNKKMPAGAVVNTSQTNFIFEFYQEEGRLRKDIKITDAASFDYYILLNRRSALTVTDRKFLATRPALYGHVDLHDVPLIYIYEGKGTR